MRAKKDAAKQPLLPKNNLKEYEVFRINLRLLRHTTGQTAEQLGKALGFKKHYRIGDLELGRGGPPKLEEVKKIASYLKVTIDQLLYTKAEVNFKPTTHE